MDTATYENFSQWIGSRPQRLGVVSRLYPHLTAAYLTESLKNIFYVDQKGADRYHSLDSLYYDWEIEVNDIRRIEFAAQPTEDGANGSEITMAFKERYYEKNDIFVIDGSRQQCMVMTRPIRRNDQYWEVNVRLVDNDYKSILDVDACQPGMTTRYIGNAQPELHQEGYIKYQSNVSKARNYITTIRHDASYSALFAATQDMFIKIGNGDGNGKASETVYRLQKQEKTLLDNFLYTRNNMLLFAKCNVNPKTGKPTIWDNRIVLLSEAC